MATERTLGHATAAMAEQPPSLPLPPGLAAFALTGRVALVTGGTSGIGLAIARALAAAGARVVVASSQPAKVEAAVAALGGAPHAGLVVELQSEAAIAGCFAQLRALLGGAPLDCLVNAAGVISRAPAEGEAASAWRRVLDVNLTGAFLCCQHAFPLLRRPAAEGGGGGAIVNVASLASTVALSDVTAYAVSKAGVAQLTRCLASDWARHGLRVNAIAPGWVPTDINRAALLGTPRGEWALRQTPLGRFGSADEMAGAVVYLLSDAASFTTGVVLPVDGGFLARGIGPC